MFFFQTNQGKCFHLPLMTINPSVRLSLLFQNILFTIGNGLHQELLNNPPPNVTIIPSIEYRAHTEVVSCGYFLLQS